MSRFVLLAGLAGLFLAWPKSSGLGSTWRSLLGLLPLLGLALALDLQAGLEVGRGAWLAGHGALLCSACAILGACHSRGRGALQALIFGLWFLLPLALGLWSHVAGSVTLDTHRLLSWSPVGSFWQGLALSGETGSGLDLQRNGYLVGAVLFWFARGRGRGVARDSDGGQD
ncbi:MAG: hypothetical protein JKY61_10055 [Planctomycetes bacterium]|nr:hypothetical protein [Planctomycetota bacterium]